MEGSSSDRYHLSQPTVKFALSSDPLQGSSEIMSKSPRNEQYNTTMDNANRSIVSFTPLITPKGDRSGSMILLSPSRTITETLNALAASTGHQLEEVWDEVGYSPEDRASQLSDLLIKFRDLCEQKIAEEKGVSETFRQTIVEAKDEIKRTAKAFKTLVDPYLLRDNSGQTLTDELAALESALEGLRADANAAREDLNECRDYLIEAHEALGLDIDPKWRDIVSDLTAQRREEFHRKKAEMKEELGTRMAAVIQLARDCQHLMSDLKIEAETDGSEIDRRIAGSLVRSKDGSFIMASKFSSDTCVGISSTAIGELTKRISHLHTEKRRRKVRLQEMGAEIALLWEKLRIPEEEQRSFTESVQGLGMDTIEKGESELKRLQELKLKMLDNLIREGRRTILALWDQIDATQDDRSSFPAFSIKEVNFNDELLDLHDEYIEKLTARLEQMKPILRLIERREVILRERIEYEELQKDSDRLKNRGAELTRQLLEEEKMARRIKKDLPRLTELLTEILVEWKCKHGGDFQYRGETYLVAIERQEEEWNRYRAEELHRKLQKKQVEKNISVENRFGAMHTRHPGVSRTRGPLGDLQPRQNSRQAPLNRSQETKPARARSNMRVAQS
jgi:Ase1/PRC1/MAP65 family protein